MLYQIHAPYFTAGIIVEDQRIVEAAPILRWSIGKPIEQFNSYAHRKGWRIIHVDES